MDNAWARTKRIPVILVVEEDEAALGAIRRTLEVAGYEVLSAKNSVEALQSGAAYGGVIDVLFTDVRMRVFQNGLELADCFGILRPETAVLLTADSPDSVEPYCEKKGWALLPRPFDRFRLLDAVGALVLQGPVPSEWVAWAQDV